MIFIYIHGGSRGNHGAYLNWYKSMFGELLSFYGHRWVDDYFGWFREKTGVTDDLFSSACVPVCVSGYSVGIHYVCAWTLIIPLAVVECWLQ